MKIFCTCGINHRIFDWPCAEIEENGKKMIERHITCNCSREVVIRTSTKDEPGYDEKDPKAADEKWQTKTGKNIFSFEEMAERMGVKPPPVAPAPVPTAAPAAVPSTPKIIIPGAEPVMPAVNSLVSLFVNLEESEVLGEALRHYGEVFKPGEMNEKVRMDFAEMSGRAIEGIFHIMDKKEAGKVRMAFSGRNLNRLYKHGEYDADESHDVRRAAVARDLRDRIFKKLDDAGA
jgi:hypothetical protein